MNKKIKNTIDNPKLVKDIECYYPRTFTGVVKDECGSIAYYENGKYHRTDGPATMWANGLKEWFIHGKYHREDGPAIEYADGTKEWYYYDEWFGWGDKFTVESWIQKWKLEIFK